MASQPQRLKTPAPGVQFLKPKMCTCGCRTRGDWCKPHLALLHEAREWYETETKRRGPRKGHKKNQGPTCCFVGCKNAREGTDPYCWEHGDAEHADEAA